MTIYLVGQTGSTNQPAKCCEVAYVKFIDAQDFVLHQVGNWYIDELPMAQDMGIPVTVATRENGKWAGRFEM